MMNAIPLTDPLFNKTKAEGILLEVSEFFSSLSERHGVDFAIDNAVLQGMELRIKLSVRERPYGMDYYAWQYQQLSELYNLSRSWLYWPVDDDKGREIQIVGFDPKRKKNAILVLVTDTQAIEHWSIEKTAQTYLGR